MYRSALSIACALALAGCVTVSNSLAPDQVRDFRLLGVNVNYASDAQILWGDGERAYAASKGISVFEADAAGRTPEGQAYMRSIISAKLKTAMDRTLAGKMTRSKPVRMEVVLKQVTIASPIQRVVIGGTHYIKADINLVDSQTGTVVLSYPAQTATSLSGQGIGGTLVDGLIGNDPMDRVVADCVWQYQNWLLGPTQAEKPS